MTQEVPKPSGREQLFALPRPEPLKLGYETYLSPYSYRYGSEEMKRNWSQEQFWLNVRDVWIATAEVQQEVGLVTQEHVDDLKAHRDEISVERIWQFERDRNVGTRHDINAAIAEFSEVAPFGGQILHIGETSEDPLGSAEIKQIHEAFNILEPKINRTLEGFGERIENHKDLACMGFTHLQPAEPTTYGYRFAKYAQDLLIDKKFMDYIRTTIAAKGIKGPVGTSAALEDLLEGTGMTPEEHERRIMEKLDLPYVTVSDQTYPRKMLFLTEVALASIAQTLHRYTLDLQILSSGFVLEVSEFYRPGQVGSSAMPHKKNPINSENVCSITETLPGHLLSSWQTGAFVTLERTLRDSAGKRSWLPESFLAIDEAITRADSVTRGLIVRDRVIAANLRKYGAFAATEILLDKLIESGMDRNEAHEILVRLSEQALEAVGAGELNPICELVTNDDNIVNTIGRDAAENAFDEILHHVGNAPRLCDQFLQNELYPAIGKTQ